MDFFKDFPVSYLDYLRISNARITYHLDFRHEGIKEYEVVKVLPNNYVNTMKEYSCFRTITKIVEVKCQCGKCDQVLYMLER